MEKYFLNTKIKDKRWLTRYFNFVEKFSLKNTSYKTENHHILPQSLFPEYKNLKVHTWNKSILTKRAHFIAHYLFAKALGGNWYAPLFFILNKNESYNLKSKIIFKAKEEQSKLFTDKNKGVVIAKIKDTGEIIKVNKDIFDNDDNLVGINYKNKDISKKISAACNTLQDNGKTMAQNRGEKIKGENNGMYDMKGELNPFYGKIHSEEAKRKIKEKAIGRKMSDETKQKIKESCSKPKLNKSNYSKYNYNLYLNGSIIFSCLDSRIMYSYLKDNNLPSLYKLNKNEEILNYKLFKIKKS